MVKYAAVTPGSIVQLGRFNKGRQALSYSTAKVVEKRTVKIGTSMFSAIAVEVAPGHVELVNIQNIKEILA